MIDLIDGVTGGDIAERFIVLRSKGKFVIGGYEEEVQPLKVWGVIGVASMRDLVQLPESDRVQGAIQIHTRTELLLTHGAGDDIGTSDIVIWRGDKYRVRSAAPYDNRGFRKYIATRMSGQ